MELILAIMVAMGGLFVSDNQEFFTTAEEQVKNGAKWHYVGKTSLDPRAQSIPAQICDEACGDPYILWKLKFPE
tara:strand:- start:399 stop:620 length:222 start_codon:yes stop_codon:yes gene_type:complete